MVSLPKQRFAYWDLKIDGRQFNEMKKYISSISVEYELNSISKLAIEVQSVSFLENYFNRGRKIEVKMGWGPLSLVKMFSGKIDKNPTGSTDDFMRYTITALDDSAVMTKKEKVRTFAMPIKQNIVSQIAGENGFIPNVIIKDQFPIAAKEMPIQKASTDLEYLLYCARKWNCVMWIDSSIRTLYFMDADVAHLQGDIIHAASPVKGLNDVAGKYSLGYKTDYAENNVAKIDWKFGKPVSSNGTASVANRQNESGRSPAKPEDYVYEFYGETYKFSPEVIKQIKRNPTFAAKIISQSVTMPIDGSEVSKYWIKYPGSSDSRTNNDLQNNPAHKVNALNVTIDLNKGDVYLRPPRKINLVCGSINSRAVTSDLPRYLVESGRLGRDFNANKVKTVLTDGMIKTSIEASL